MKSNQINIYLFFNGNMLGELGLTSFSVERNELFTVNVTS